MTPSDLPRLCDATLADLPPDVARPDYDREALEIGVVHLGPGAFFRAHQMDVYDRLASGDRRWGVAAVSLRSTGLRDALAPQDRLYTLAKMGEAEAYRVIGALCEVIVASEQPQATLARLAAPATRLVGLTVTESGYHLDADGKLDLADPEVRADLLSPAHPSTPVGWLAAGLRVRRAAGLEPFVTASCDNLNGNGRKLRAAVLDFLAATHEADLAGWVAEHAPFPDSMVDSITPATDEATRLRAAQALGMQDAWPVQREAFTQWVLQDLPHPVVQALAHGGVSLTHDVGAYERAKLRLLNGAHSTLAYLGQLAGLETVGEAMAEPRLRAFVENLMREDIAASLSPAAGLDLQSYIDSVLARFANPAMRHRLSQIAWDGSKKLPVRLADAVAQALASGRPLARLATPFAAWMWFLVLRARAGEPPVDPLADDLMRLGEAARDQPERDVAGFLGLTAVFSAELAAAAPFRAAVVAAYAALSRPDPLDGLS